MDEQATNGERQEQQEKDHIAGVGVDLRDEVNVASGESKHQDHDDEVEGLVHGKSFRVKLMVIFVGSACK